MAKRVLMQGGVSSAMRVSLPGYDVTTATINQTCFDSRWSGLTPYMTGTIDSVNDQAQLALFGETLDQPPLFVGHFMTLSPNNQPSTAFGNTPTMFRGGGTDQWWYVLVTTSFLQFRGRFGGQSSRLFYTLFKRPAG